MATPQSTTSYDGVPRKTHEQITFRFCSECSNMLYPKEDQDAHKLQYTCRTCQYTEEAQSSCIFRNELNTSAGETAGVTQDVGSDPTVSGVPHCVVDDSGDDEDALVAAAHASMSCLCCGTVISCAICGVSTPDTRLVKSRREVIPPASVQFDLTMLCSDPFAEYDEEPMKEDDTWENDIRERPLMVDDTYRPEDTGATRDASVLSRL